MDRTNQLASDACLHLFDEAVDGSGRATFLVLPRIYGILSTAAFIVTWIGR
jgi:hypothetical protein